MASDGNVMWSDASSSIYSTDEKDDAFIVVVERDTKPLINRSHSTAKSTRSAVSHVSTVYSEEAIKELGYRPFEYWKPPKPAARERKRQQERTLRPPPPPPPARMHSLRDEKSRMFPGQVNALQDFQPVVHPALQHPALDPARAVDVQRSYLPVNDNSNNANANGMHSPRVKDRYVARRARLRAIRKRQHAEWPGWVPDEKVLGIRTKRTVLDGRRMAAAGRPLSDTSSALLSSSAASNHERWSSPSTWRRRVWGILVALGILVLVAVGIVVTVFWQDFQKHDGG